MAAAALTGGSMALTGNSFPTDSDWMKPPMPPKEGMHGVAPDTWTKPVEDRWEKAEKSEGEQRGVWEGEWDRPKGGMKPPKDVPWQGGQTWMQPSEEDLKKMQEMKELWLQDGVMSDEETKQMLEMKQQWMAEMKYPPSTGMAGDERQKMREMQQPWDETGTMPTLSDEEKLKMRQMMQERMMGTGSQQGSMGDSMRQGQMGMQQASPQRQITRLERRLKTIERKISRKEARLATETDADRQDDLQDEIDDLKDDLADLEEDLADLMGTTTSAE
jgi:hypothetical protein